MIAHVILFRPRPELTPSERRAVLDAFTVATSSAPNVRSVRIGRRVRHGRPGYEQAMQEDYEYLAVVEFDNVEGLMAYLGQPAHAEAGRHFMTSAAAALAYDYEWVTPSEAG